MKEKILEFLKKNFFVFAIIFSGLLISLLNYTPDTFLTGWDTLHPEFNFPLNLKRVLDGVWRQEQGLGALAAHAHMSDLPRILILWLFSFLLPLNFLRYFFFFATLILGPLGVYFFLKKTLFLNKNSPFAFLGSLFYLLNLGTLQHYYVPFEMFATCFAALPWLLFLAHRWFSTPSRKNLLLFLFVTFLSSPMAYAATLWYAYFAILSLFLLTLFFNNKTQGLKKVFLLLVTTILVNAYWILPNLYFAFTSGQIVQEAKINQLFSQNAFLHDARYANLQNASILKGFLFDWQKFEKGSFVNLLANWQIHLSNPAILAIGYLIFIVIFLGIIFSIVGKPKEGRLLLPILVFGIFFLLHNQFPLNIIYERLRSFSFFKEALRFPWTKFSIFVIFCYAFYFSLGLKNLLDLINKRIVLILGKIFAILLLVVWMWPAFRGDFIDSNRRVEIPHEYFQTFNWFASQPENSRVALLPVPAFWGWEYHSWGFEGAGFIWFGLPQSILARDFDRWDESNENFYWEISYALYNKNLTLFENVLSKYKINYLLVDRTIINPAFPKAVFYEELDDLLASSSKAKKTAEYGKIQIYQVEQVSTSPNFIYEAYNLPKIAPNYEWNNIDFAYGEYGDYQEGDDIYYPFRSLFTNRSTGEREFELEILDEEIVFRQKVPSKYTNYTLIPPSPTQELVRVNADNFNDISYIDAEIELLNDFLQVKIPKVGGYWSAEINPTNITQAQNCNRFTNGFVKNEIAQDGYLRLTSVDALNCSAAFSLPQLPHNLSYLISVESRNLSGKEMLFWLENLNIRKADIESYLPENPELETGNLKLEISNFIQPPMEIDGLGYILHFDNSSIGNFPSVNDLGRIAVYQIPYKYLLSIKLLNYNSPQKPTLVLAQSYNEGWLAYEVPDNTPSILAPLLGEKISKHFRVNNWSNGWEINKEKKIVVLYWPQYLEYFGLFLLALTLLIVAILSFTAIRNSTHVPD